MDNNMKAVSCENGFFNGLAKEWKEAKDNADKLKVFSKIKIVMNDTEANLIDSVYRDNREDLYEIIDMAMECVIGIYQNQEDAIQKWHLSTTTLGLMEKVKADAGKTR